MAQGTPVFCGIDDIVEIRTITEKHGIWLHIEGNSLNSLATLSDAAPDLALNEVASADSVTCRVGSTFGFSYDPVVVSRLKSPAS